MCSVHRDVCNVCAMCVLHLECLCCKLMTKQSGNTHLDIVLQACISAASALEVLQLRIGACASRTNDGVAP